MSRADGKVPPPRGGAVGDFAICWKRDENFLHAVELAVAGVARDLQLLDHLIVQLFSTPSHALL